MSDEKIVHLSVQPEAGQAEPGPPARPRRTRVPRRTSPPDSSAPVENTPPSPVPPSWFQFVREGADDFAVAERFAGEATAILKKSGAALGDYCVLGLMDSDTQISDFELDRVFAALQTSNPNRDKNVLLILLSSGGSIEPAYQMSKLCKSFARDRFVVAVPRQAKSAATLLAIGADEIHMGPLGHLGPIDPQLGGLPALGVSQALKSIAAVAAQYPGSSDMFSRYLKLALTVEQIGYCERISESAAQYAERLLQTKSNLPNPAMQIANELVQEYKHHGFVIDFDEAQQHLGENWIKTATPEILAAEQLYTLYEQVNLFLGILAKKRMLLAGSFRAGDVLVFNRGR